MCIETAQGKSPMSRAVVGLPIWHFYDLVIDLLLLIGNFAKKKQKKPGPWIRKIPGIQQDCSIVLDYNCALRFKVYYYSTIILLTLAFLQQ